MNIKKRIAVLTVFLMSIGIFMPSCEVMAMSATQSETLQDVSTIPNNLLSQSQVLYVTVYKGLNGGAGVYISDLATIENRSLNSNYLVAATDNYVENIIMWDSELENKVLVTGDCTEEEEYAFVDMLTKTSMLACIVVGIADSKEFEWYPVDDSVQILPGNYIYSRETCYYPFTSNKRYGRESNGAIIDVLTYTRKYVIPSPYAPFINTEPYDFSGDASTQYLITPTLINVKKNSIGLKLTLTGTDGYVLVDTYKMDL